MITHLLAGFILSVMVLFPSPDDGWSRALWMQAYERYLYWQMEQNFEREAKEEALSKEGQSYVEVGYTLGADTGGAGKVETAVLPDAETMATAGTDANINPTAEALVRTVDEQTAEEETEQQQPTTEEAVVETVPQESTAEVEAQGTAAVVTENQTACFPLYTVEGHLLDPAIQEYLYQRLCEAGIGWFFEPSIWICYQESRFDVLAENPNGEDKGLLQYKIKWVPWMDWRNPYVQIDYFVAQMSNRANAGCDVLTMISRHKTSDYDPYDPVYVAQVTQWQPYTVQVR